MNKRKKSVMRAGAVILVALAAGHLVQTMNAEKVAAAPEKPKAIEQVSAGPDDTPVPAPLAAGAALVPALPAPTPAPALVVTEPEAPPAPEAPLPAALPGKDAAVPATPEAALPEPAVPQETADACAPKMVLAAGPQAMISVSITAPCRAGERIVLRHAGLALAEKLPAEGSLQLDIPALQPEGEVSALFADAEVLRDSIAIPDAAAMRRFAVQWMADDTFQLHAFENGADYGQPGEVWSGAPVSPNGGYLVSLGDPTLDLPMLAEVYTWPATAPADVSIEAAVTETTCGRELLGEVLEAKGGKVSSTDLTLAMPECDALGDILVLKNPGQDVTLSAVN